MDFYLKSAERLFSSRDIPEAIIESVLLCKNISLEELPLEFMMNALRINQGVSNETDRCRKNYIREKNMVSSFGMVRNVDYMKSELSNNR